MGVSQPQKVSSLFSTPHLKSSTYPQSLNHRMHSNNPYAQGGWNNSQNAHGSSWSPNAWNSQPPTFGALPVTPATSSIMTFEFSAFQPNILNSVVIGPNKREFFTIRTPTPASTAIYKAGTLFSTIFWQTNPIVEAAGLISRQRTGDFLKIAANNR